jgi:TPR repeat protein
VVVTVPGALVVLAVAVAVTFWLTHPDTQSGPGSSAISAALDPEVKKAAEAGDAGAQFRLGESLLQDPARSAETSASAVRWLQMAAENGNTEAMIVLGRLSRTGVGVLQNFGQASKWIQTAASRGNPEGMLELGRLYRDGIGVEKDLVRAYVWFNRASAARNLDAVREREAIARTLTFEELREAQNQSSAVDSESSKPAGKGARHGT